jgi:hypothetical protein
VLKLDIKEYTSDIMPAGRVCCYCCLLPAGNFSELFKSIEEYERTLQV